MGGRRIESDRRINGNCVSSWRNGSSPYHCDLVADDSSLASLATPYGHLVVTDILARVKAKKNRDRPLCPTEDGEDYPTRKNQTHFLLRSDTYCRRVTTVSDGLD